MKNMIKTKEIKKLSKTMNFRPFVILAIALMVAIFFACSIFVSTISKLVVFIVLMSAFVVSFALVMLYGKKFIMMITVTVLICSIPFAVLYGKCLKLETYSDYSGSCYIRAKIDEHYKLTTSGNLCLVLSDVEIVDGDEKHTLDGKISLYTNPNNLKLADFSVGRYLVAKTSLTFFDMQGTQEYSLSNLSKNLIALGYSNYYDITCLDEYDVSVRDKVCLSIYNDLSALNLEHGDLGYAMMFGETSYLDENVKTSFQSTGIAHLLAVSGLHFSIIFGILSFITKRSDAGYKMNFFMDVVVIFIYCYLCKFTVSVLRAGLMAFFASLSKRKFKAYDSASVLSLVAILFLIVNPLCLFNTSFMLSFSAVLSINLLSAVFLRFFSQIFKDKVSSALAVNLSVQIGMFCVTVFYFGSYNILTGIVNLLLIPIATYAFMILFIGVLVSRIFPIAIYLSKIYDFLMDIVVRMNVYFSRVGFSLHYNLTGLASAIVVFALAFVISDYLFANRKKKLAFVLPLAVVAGVLFLV